MRTTTILLFIAGALLGAFGYWGSYTKSGRARYDEMAGIIPEFATLAAVVLLLVALILSFVLFLRSRKPRGR